MISDYLFVYGSLRKASNNAISAKLLNHSLYLGEASIHAKLYEIAGYPGIIESNQITDYVYGEVYQLRDTRLLSVLDDYEECSSRFPLPHEYIRKAMTVYLSNKQPLTAWVYVYNRDVSILKQLNHRYPQ